MNPARDSIKIDSQKLRDSVTERGYTLASASRKLGRSDGFISNFLKRGRTNKAAVVAIAEILKIPSEEYVIKEQTEDLKDLEDVKIEGEESKLLQFGENNLYRIIYCSVLAALQTHQGEKVK